MTAPLDQVHADCVEARLDVRRWFTVAKLAAAQWVPADPPGTCWAASTVPGTLDDPGAAVAARTDRTGVVG